MRRWTGRILLIVLIVIVVALIAVQVALWTDYPRRIILSQIQQQLGLRVQASSLTTGWLGSTTLRDVKLSLPLADESFLDLPEMSLEHTALLPLAITRNFQLRQIELHKPILVVRRDSQGRWNLQDVAELLAKAGGGKPEPGTPTRPPKLPRLRLIEGTIVVIESNGQRAMIAPLTVTGDPDGPLVYRYDAEVPNRLKAVGEVAPGENWKHEVRIYADPKDWLTPWVAEPPTPLVVNANWSGILDKGVLNGRLLIEEAKYETFTANGRVVVQAGGEATLLRPQDLVITTAIEAVPQVQIASGTVQVDGTRLRARQVRVSAVGGEAQVDGTGDLSAKTADINAVWLELPLPGEIRHSGNIALQVKTPFPGRPEIAGSLVTRGSTPQGQWDAELQLEGAGRSWSNIDWVLRMQRGSWAAKLPLTAEHFTARVAQRGQVFTLTEVDWPDHQVFADGRFDAGSKAWSLRLQGRELITTAVDFSLDVRGNPERVLLKEFAVSASGVDFKADGVYVMGVPAPVDLRFYLTHMPQDLPDQQDSPIRGRLTAEGHVGGTITPMDLSATGTLRTRDFVLLDRPYGDIRGVVEGHIVKNSAEFTVRDLALLGGQWRLNGVWPYTGTDKLTATEPLRVKVFAENLAMRDVADLLDTPNVTGEAGGEWTIDIPIRNPRRDTIAMRGSFRGTGITADQLRIDEITGQTTLQGGTFRADPVRMSRAERNVSGTATLSLHTTLANPKQPRVVMTTQTWPVPLGETGMAAVTLDTDLAIDAENFGASGPLTARAIVATTQRAIGEATVEGHIDGKVATLNRIAVTGAGGTAEGRAVVNAAAPTQTTATLRWSDIDGERLADLVPEMYGLTGRYSGEATLSPATADRALEPLRLTIGIAPNNGHFQTIDIGPMKFSAFLNLDSKFGLERIVLDELPAETMARKRRQTELDSKGVAPTQRPVEWNEIRVADGSIRLWGRRGQHQTGVVQSHVIVDFDMLNLDQIIHAFLPEDKDPVPGRVHGQMILHGDPQQRDLLFGEGHAQITHSDLGNIKAFAFLYNALRIGTAPREPSGHGSLDISLQANTLSLRNLRYFNRGAEARSALVEIGDVWQMPDSPIDGYIVGTARPLAGIKLPLIADVDKILSVVQSGLTTVRVHGTVEDYNVSLGALNDAGEGLRRLIAGDARGDAQR